MIKGLNIILSITALIALVAVYLLKYQTVDTANAKLDLEQQIAQQESDLSVLKADWAYLNQPSHIEPLVVRFADVLEFEPVSQSQFISIDDIPMRAPEPDTAGMDALFEALESGVDPIAALIEANAT